MIADALRPRLAAVRASAPEGCCPFCRRPLPEGRRVDQWVCARKRCRTQYLALYAQDRRRPSTLHQVVRWLPMTGGKEVGVLDCGHNRAPVYPSQKRATARCPRGCPARAG